MTEIDSTIAARLRAIKDTLNLDYAKMAEMCDAPKSSVMNWLMEYNKPRHREMSLLAERTGVSFEWIYLGGQQKIGDETFVS